MYIYKSCQLTRLSFSNLQILKYYFSGIKVFKSTSRAFAIEIIVNNVGLPTALSIIFIVSRDIPAFVAKFGRISYEDCNKDSFCGDFLVVFPSKEMKLGKDVFNFYFGMNGFVPRGMENDKNYVFNDYCDTRNISGKEKDNQGRWCTAWVIYNSNMDYLHCNDLDWKDKTKCDKK